MKTLKILAAVVALFLTLSETASSEGGSRSDKDYGYVICVDDLLEISVYEEPDLSKIVRVSSDGKIAYPLVGSIDVEGMTARGLEEKLTELLAKDYLVNPQVSVFIKEYTKISVLGQVKKPGAYELRVGMTVVDAIALAGGFTDIASGNGTKVIRMRGKTKEVIQVPVETILRGGASSKDIVLESNDTVVVPESFF